MKNFIIFLLFNLFVCFPLMSENKDAKDVESFLNSATQKYQKGDYSGAIEDYKKVESAGISSELLFNMGNAYFKEGDWGYARWCYLKALKLNPYNTDARNNEQYIDAKVLENNKAELKGKKINISPDDISFFSKIKSHATRRVSSDTWALLSVIFFVTFILCIAAYLFLKRVSLRKVGFFGSIICLPLSVLALSLSYMAGAETRKSNEGVVCLHKVQLADAPSDSANLNKVPLTKGTLFEILETRYDTDGRPVWYKVKYNSEMIGWVNAESILVVSV